MQASFFLLVLMAPVLVQAAGPLTPHEHGVASLQIVVDGPQLEVHLDTPLENLVGFEQAPRTDKQREAVRAMASQMRQGLGLLTPTAGAGCALVSVQLASAVIPPPLLGETGPAVQTSGGTSGHADLEAGYVFRCTAPERLTGLEVGLAKAFRGIRTVKVRVAGPRGQKAMTLERGRTSVQW